ncbi:HNH endonuclease family protein (plasmid) [Streptomyces sp. Q6]|uniref:HNH endonuclease family protein n=1 Tax=Streptomyces citrinus TaxID=3118173 RepID=A0ACD5AV54_9ACTN
MRLLATATSTAAALAALISPVAPAPGGPGPLGSPGDMLSMPVSDAVKVLPVAAEHRSGYERTAFHHWVDADHDGCDTRAEVLKAEAFISPQSGARCKISGGEWYSSYDNTYVGDAHQLDVDHMVPLAEAWDSGAATWSANQREAYANDLGDERSLRVVSAKTNRAKGDQDVAQWLPPFAGARCAYVADWVATKMRWQLAVDTAEKRAITKELASCPNTPVRVVFAR